MNLDLAHLRALSATVREGTLDAAARALHVTPSAISQRLRALETATGRVLLVRSRPVRVTESGEVLLRLARQVELLTSEAVADLGGTDDDSGAERPPTLPIAVNADSLGTWVLPALAPLAGSVCLELHREDETQTAALLRAGTVVAAVTADPEPVPGCSVTRLGTMRYRPMAAPSFAEQWCADGPTAQALTRAPVVVFDRADDLQHRYLRGRLGAGTGADHARPPQHQVPATADFLEAVRLGFGWGMVPALQADDDVAAGRLVDLDPSGAVDVVLHWQQWKLRSALLDRVARAVVTAARAHLHP